MPSLSGTISLKKLILSPKNPSITSSVLAMGGAFGVASLCILRFWLAGFCADFVLYLFPCSLTLPLALIIVLILHPWWSLRFRSKECDVDVPFTAEHQQFFIFYMLSSWESPLILAQYFSIWAPLSVFFFRLNSPWSKEKDTAPLPCIQA